jgi:uncharacterized protein YbjT (DUF2867 family)
MMILVVGATGYLGGMITRTLLDQGQSVRILVRPASSYQDLVDAGAQPITGDLKDRTSLDRACDGIDVVITTANSAQRGGDDNPRTVDLEGNRNLIEAAKAVGTEQFIYVSAYGCDVDSPVPFMQAKAQTEIALRESGLPYTILAPTIFMDIWIPMIVGMALQQARPVVLIGEGQNKHSFIAVKDVAAYAVAAIDHPSAIDQSIPLGGPEPVSWRNIIDVSERALDRSIPVRTVPIGQPLPGYPETITGLMTSLEMYEAIIPMESTTRTFGVPQTTVEEFVRGMVADLPTPASPST